MKVCCLLCLTTGEGGEGLLSSSGNGYKSRLVQLYHLSDVKMGDGCRGQLGCIPETI